MGPTTIDQDDRRPTRTSAMLIPQRFGRQLRSVGKTGGHEMQSASNTSVNVTARLYPKLHGAASDPHPTLTTKRDR